MFQSYFKVPIMKLIVQNIVLYVAYNGNLNSSENGTKLDIIDYNLHVTGYHKRCSSSNCILDKNILIWKQLKQSNRDQNLRNKMALPTEDNG